MRAHDVFQLSRLSIACARARGGITLSAEVLMSIPDYVMAGGILRSLPPQP